MTLLDRIGKLISYSELFERQPTLAELSEVLRPFRRHQVVLRLAWLNALTNQWQSLGDSDVDERMRKYVLPSLAPRLKTWRDRQGEGFVFVRFSLLWLMRFALLNRTDEGSMISTREDLEQLGIACLMANDLAASSVPTTDPIVLAANMLAQRDYFSREGFLREVARNKYMLETLAPSADDSLIRDLPGRIEAGLGCSLTEYTDLALASALKPIGAQTEVVESFLIPSVRPENFETTSFPTDRVAVFLESISACESEYVAAFTNSPHSTDLTAFRDRPFLKADGTYVPLDAALVLDKAGHGLFWSALKRVSKSAEREAMLQLWGKLFELHVNSLFRSNDLQYMANAVFSDGSEAFDGCLIEGRTIVVVETKANTIPNKVRYADDPVLLRDILEQRFITGSESGRKGLAQLSHSIFRFAGGEALKSLTTGEVVNPKDVSKIIPVVIYLDNALGSPGMNAYMARRFREMGKPRRIIVTPLTLIQICELEGLDGMFGDYDFGDMVESFLGSLRSDPLASFLADGLPILQGQTITTGRMAEIFSEKIDGLFARLFPNAGERPKRR